MQSSASSERSDGVAAVDRALHVATTLANAPRGLTLSELANVTRMYKSTLLRLLSSLERAGLVTHRADKRYALGSLAFMFGRSYEQAHGLKGAIQPILQWLVDQGTESPSFHVRHDRERRLCLIRVDSNHSTLDRVRTGDMLPLHRGAAGKVITTLDSAIQAQVPAPSDLIFTSFGERDPLCAAIAAPVFGPSMLLLGAISVSGPLERFSELAVERMKGLVLAAAQSATRSLGGNW